MKTIGFGGTYYTLWDVEVEKVNVAIGAWYNKVTCTYYKNLSKDLDTAIEKAGTDNLDENLKGKTKSFKYNTDLVKEPLVMTDKEMLFDIILRNHPNHTIEFRKSALARMLELGYIEEKEVVVTEVDLANTTDWKTVLKDVKVRAYVYNEDSDEVWYHNELGIKIKS